MAENDDSSLISFDIERSIQQVLDTQEDEDDCHSQGINMFFNEANSRGLGKNFLDNASDYARRRSKIEHIDNKSLFSHPDHYISLVQDDVSQEEIDKNGNYFLPFTDPDAKWEVDNEANDPKFINSLIVSDSLNDEAKTSYFNRENNKLSQSLNRIALIAKKSDSLTNLIDALKIKIKDYKSVELSIEWEDRQFRNENLNIIFENFRQVNKISIIDSTNFEVLFCWDRNEISILNNTELYEKDIRIEPCQIYSSPTQSHKREIGRGHHKCKSMNEWGEWMNKLTKDDPYKDAFSASKMNPNNRQRYNFSTHKYTWRYEIQIENDREFQVARKLIGAKGCNMKRILEECNRVWKLIHDEKDQIFNTQDIVKLRLRGQGSGFKEGPYNEESNEPLHLCISSKYSEVYDKAWEMTEELINSVYDQFYKHQIKKNSYTK